MLNTLKIGSWRLAFYPIPEIPDEPDIWASGAIVRVGDSTYTENTPAAHVYHVTMCRGDLNNDGSVSFKDINPFVLALSDPSAYASAFPGLSGCMAYHGDINCDGTFDFRDINPFVVLLGNPCCRSNYDPCPGDDLAERPTPRQLAVILAANVAPDLYDRLVAIVEQVVAWEPDADRRAYWAEVYVRLTR